ncbi:methyl-accepting chemotaxis protein [Enterovibrio sp. ZSDZ42]|uniref:Methyl-accepting chemotaxis protein n=1 Tax=Enterovibrio gelatinilyticus TaxID=2899819 RepID=A0ABT5R1S9_9GAMM|nr:HAMP domain-containing methyl-accepting chemotaxis protein [Enterovibrio sp. ZSDZ42]MDD1793979.1 methyl-accepting chemotaxis protein [Enterovibrio sp. ZSDZ42]
MRKPIPQTIKAQLSSIVLLILASVFVFAITFQLSFKELSTLDSASVDILKSQTSVLMLRRHEKDFMARSDVKYKDKFDKEYNAIRGRLSNALDKLTALDMPGREAIRNMLSKLSNYQRDFDSLVTQRVKVGVEHDTGLKGATRTASHRVEQAIQHAQDDTIYRMLLMLRRHEKDFLLRADERYIDEFNALFSTLGLALTKREIPTSDRLLMTTSLNDYHQAFNSLAESLKKIGLSPKQGLHGSLRATVQETETQMKSLSEELIHAIDQREHQITNTLTLIGGSLAVIVCLSLILIIRHVTQKIAVANHLMANIAKGNSSLNVRMKLPGNDELSQLASHFNQFITSLQHTMEKISAISTELSSNARHSRVMAGSTANNAEKQRAESDSVSTAMNEMTATSREIAQSVARAASVAQELQSSATTGREVNSETSVKATQLSESMRSASDNMQRLNDDSEDIGSVIDVIRSITEQTNLLALNAAIEAARAGDQGRGFAVVADQVRELAMKTHQSTDEITKIIEQLQGGIRHSVSVMNESSEMATISVNQAREGAAVMSAMVEQIEDIAGQNMQIATASEEQTTVTDSVDRNIVIIAELAGETASAAQKSSHSATTIEQLANELDGLVGTFTGKQEDSSLQDANQAHINNQRGLTDTSFVHA